MNNLRLVTLDATGTIFKFKEPPPTTYVKFAQKYDLKCHENDVQKQFRIAYKTLNITHPHFGALSGISSKQWWCHVVQKTFEGRYLSHQILPSCSCQFCLKIPLNTYI